MTVHHSAVTVHESTAFSTPRWHWGRPHAPFFAHEIDDAPPVVALVDVARLTDDRRSPQPKRTAGMARSRRPFFVRGSGVFKSVCACKSGSQFPARTRCDRTSLIYVRPAANSGASRAEKRNPFRLAAAHHRPVDIYQENKDLRL
jgi:hypothetical protein